MKQELEPAARIFICVNEKPPPKASCLAGEGEKCVTWLRDEVIKRKLQDKVWVTRTKCQGYCVPDGTCLIVEPLHEQFSSVRFSEIPDFFEKLLKKLES